jgi:phage gpG-like protein
MAGLSFEIQDREVQEVLQDLIEAGQDPEPAFRSVGRALQTRVQLGFRQSRDPFGVSWPPPKGRDGQPLRDSNRLYDSIDYQADDSGVAVGTNVVYARIHNQGGVIRARNHPYLTFRVGEQWVRKKQVRIPQRQFLPTDTLPPAWRRDVLGQFAKHFGGDRGA